MDTLGTEMRTLIIKLIKNSESQERIREEIFCERVVGEEITPQDMTYLKCFILESLRNQDTCLRAKPKSLKNSIHFDGHYFPKGTACEINLDILHRHPLLWERADECLPQRFSDNGTVEF